MAAPGRNRSEHFWSLSRVLAYRVGLLEEQEERRFLAHLESCQECREALQSLSDGVTPRGTEGAHVSAGLIARWDRARSVLRGLERAMVGQHLEGCEDCRRDLEFLGFEPSLAPVLDTDAEGIAGSVQTAERPGEETRLEPGPAEDRPGRSQEAGTIRAHEPRERGAGGGWPRWRWALGGCAAVATAVVLLWLQRTPPEREMQGVVPWVRPGSVRGQEEGITVDADESARLIVLAITVPATASRTKGLTIEVRSPAGALLLRSFAEETVVGTGTVVLALVSPGPFEPGQHEVLLWDGRGGADSDAIEKLYFRVRVTGNRRDP